MMYNISLQEYPGEVCIVLYHGRCNLSCDYCFNELDNKELSWYYAKSSIDECKKFITAVCITGGEPLICKDFVKIVRYAHDCGLKVKVNTNATMKETLYYRLPSIDYCNIGVKESTKLDTVDLLHLISDRVDYTIVYHKWLPDMKTKVEQLTKDRLFNPKPNNIIISQLKTGECRNPDLNQWISPCREECIEYGKQFSELCAKGVIVETREYGKEKIEKYI